MSWAVWVGGVDDTYTTETEARQAAAEWRRKGYNDVIVERVPEWEPDHPAVIAWRQQNRPRTLAERTYAVRERRGIPQPTGAGRRFRLWCGFLTLFISAGLVEEAPGAAVVGLLIGAACVLPEMIGGNR